MKIIITILSIAISFSVMAQNPKKKKSSGFMNTLKKIDEMNKSAEASSKEYAAHAASLRQLRPGYETRSGTYYNFDLEDMPLPGYYILKNGQKVEAIIGYQRPQFLIGLSNALFICKAANGKKIDALNPHLDSNFKEWVKYEDLKTFFVADQLYARNLDGYFTTIINEGAIHTYTGIKLWNKETQKFKVYPIKRKLGGASYGTALDRITEVELLSLMSDAPQIVDGFKNGEYPLNEAEIKYNVWYEENNPGKVNYIFGKDYGVTSKPAQAVSQGSSDYDKEVKEATESAHRAPRIDVFAGRPTTASAAVASAKPEVAVKKQSFKDRLARIKADGNKVGILVTCKNLVINPGSASEGITRAQVLGSYGPLEGIDKIAKTTANDLNAGFQTDVFEAIDYSQIPVKEGKYGKMDDWWSTKYKVIVMYELEPSYSAIYKVVNSETLEREYQAKMHVHGEMIVMSAEEIKPGKLKYVTSSPKTWGYYNSEKFIGPAETDFHTIQQLKAAINPPSDEEVVDAIIKSQKSGLDKFVRKKSK